MPGHWASSSRSVEGNIAELGSRFTVLEAISNNPQGEGLHLGFCLDLGSPIREHTWKFWNLGDPATILFVLELDLESHNVCFQRPSVLRRPVRPALPVEHPGSAAKAALNDGSAFGFVDSSFLTDLSFELGRWPVAQGRV